MGNSLLRQTFLGHTESTGGSANGKVVLHTGFRKASCLRLLTANCEAGSLKTQFQISTFATKNFVERKSDSNAENQSVLFFV